MVVLAECLERAAERGLLNQPAMRNQRHQLDLLRRDGYGRR
jgi:hypothetical protein